MTAPRSLADAIRAMHTDQVERLLTVRPDLSTPRPTSLADLAERAASPTSARLAIDALNAFDRRICVALAAGADAMPARRLAALLQVDRTPVADAAARLRDRALAWGDDRSLHLTSGARQALGPFPAGLAPASAVPMTDAEIDQALAAGGPEVRALLERLVWELPVGQVRDADRRGSGDSPADRALALRLLRPREAHTAILPREVSLRLRGGRLFEHAVPTSAPAWPASETDENRLRRNDRAGLGAAIEVVGQVEIVVDAVGAGTMRPLASGGLARRDAAALFQLVGSEAVGALVVNLAAQAGLLASTGAQWLPTGEFDRWAADDDWSRWQSLRAAWPLVGAWPGGGALLAPATVGGWSLGLRGEVLRQIRHASPGTEVTVERLVERIEFTHPTWRAETLPDLCALAIDELTSLGVLALGRRTALLDATTDPGFPTHVDRFVVQGDLTAISTAPLTREVGSVLGLLAARESAGGAGVHRFTAASIRAGLDAGWTAESIREWIERHSLTGVPQPLAYLVDDVARRHGALQVSAVSSVVTIDDPALAEALLNDARARALGLRRIADRVLGASAEPDEVVGLLRSIGHAPIARDESGQTATTPAARRARTPNGAASAALGRTDLHRLAEDLRAHDDPSVHARSSDEMVELITRHAGSDGWLEIDHALDDGTPLTTTARVVDVTSGWAELADRTGARLAVPLARVVGVRMPKRLHKSR